MMGVQILPLMMILFLFPGNLTVEVSLARWLPFLLMTSFIEHSYSLQKEMGSAIELNLSRRLLNWMLNTKKGKKTSRS